MHVPIVPGLEHNARRFQVCVRVPSVLYFNWYSKGSIRSCRGRDGFDTRLSERGWMHHLVFLAKPKTSLSRLVPLRHSPVPVGEMPFAIGFTSGLEGPTGPEAYQG